MEEKLKRINKTRTCLIFVLFISIFLSLFVPVLSFVTSLSCCVLYILSVVEVKLNTGKLNIPLFFACMLAVFFLIFNFFYSFTFSKTIGLFFIYLYINLSFKTKTGSWNKWFIYMGIVALLANILSIVTGYGWITFIGVLLQLYCIFKYIDPILEKIALDHRAKRLAAEAAEKESNENIV